MNMWLSKVLAVALFLGSINLYAQKGEPFLVEQISDGHWRISIHNSAPLPIVEYPDFGHSAITLPGHELISIPGNPALPYKKFSFAADDNAGVRISVSGLETYNINADLNVAEGNEPLDLGQEVQGGQGYLFNSGISVTPAGAFHELNLLSVRYDHTTQTISWLKRATIDVSLEARSLASPLPDLPIDTEKRIREYNQETDGMASWYVPGEEMLKIRTLERGVYRLSYSDLEAAGLALQGIDPATFAVYYNGKQIPLYVEGESDGSFDPGDYIDFYAERLRGEFNYYHTFDSTLSKFPYEYYDKWSNENTYWLSWGGLNGERFEDLSAAPQGNPLREVPLQKHLEEDHLHHAGDFSDRDAQSTKLVYGEGFKWTYILRDSTFATTLQMPAGLTGEVTILTKMKVASKDDSRIELRLNGTAKNTFIVNKNVFGGYAYRVDTTVIPAADFLIGANELRYTSVRYDTISPEDAIERVTLDWVKVFYTATAAASNDRFEYVPSESWEFPEPRNTAEFVGFSSDEIRVLDLSNNNVLGQMQAVGSGTNNGVRFAYAPDAHYFAYTGSGVLTPASMTRTSIPDVLSSSAGGDYIVITHSRFVDAANRLAQHRASSDGYRTEIRTVEDIYNALNFGHKSPVPIKRMMLYAYERWQEPAPRFALFLGDASWDPKQNERGAFKVDYVPSFGRPVSDAFYVSMDSIDIYTLMAYGRIPAESNEDAHAVVDKIIEYETAPPQDWNNRFLFAAGGKNQFEITLFTAENEYFINQYIIPNCLEHIRFIKPNHDLVSIEDLDTIITHMNRGIFWFNFLGHGGTRIIDIGIESPDIFKTQGHYPVFSTMSCNTAHFAENKETGLNEKFIMARQNGSIISLGTSGLGFVDIDRNISKFIFQSMVFDSARTFGEAIQASKIGIRDIYDIPFDVRAVNSLHQFILLGDPATVIPGRGFTELAVGPEDISSNPEVLIEGERSTIVTRIHNFGYCLKDTVEVRIGIDYQGNEIFSGSVMLDELTEEVDLPWQPDFSGIAGEITIRVEVDPAGSIVERTKQNNTTEVKWNVLPRGIKPIFPNGYGTVSKRADRITMTVANPSIVPENQGDVEVELQIARSVSFNNPVFTTITGIEPVFTWFEWPHNGAQAGIYFWRARMIIGGTPDDWSSVSSFTLIDEQADELAWQQASADQLSSAQFISTGINSEGHIALTTTDVKVDILSAGNNNGEINNLSQIIVDGAEVSPNKRGFNVAVIEPRKGQVFDAVFFDTYAGGRAESAVMAAYLTNIPDDYFVAIGIRDDANGFPQSAPEGTNISPELRASIRTFGSDYIDSVGYRDSFAFFGRRTDALDSREAFSSYGAAFFEDTITVKAVSGAFQTPTIGPAKRWVHTSWTGELGSPGSTVDIQVLSVAGDADTLLLSKSGIAPGTPLDLSAINAGTFPRIWLRVMLNDTSFSSSPAIEELRVSYESGIPDIGITSQVISASPDSVQRGEPITIDIDVFNTGEASLLNVPVTVRIPTPGGDTDISTTIAELPGGRNEYASVSLEIPTNELRGAWNAQILLDPEGMHIDQYPGNNTYARTFRTSSDQTRPDLDVLFDGIQIMDFDHVSATPKIQIALFDSSPLPVDTSSIALSLDGNNIHISNNPLVTYSLGGAAEEKIQLVYTPELSPGIHRLSVSGRDADGNAADSIPYEVYFNVSTENLVDRIYPVPNPSEGPMNFTFRMLGMSLPEEAYIKIYTLSGRVIKEVPVSSLDLRIGHNSIFWNGRDEDGDDLANGVYLYKLYLRRGDEAFEHIGKIAILR